MTLLRDFGVPRHVQLGIILVLGEDEEVLDDWCLWIADNHPTERMIMDKLLEKEQMMFVMTEPGMLMLADFEQFDFGFALSCEGTWSMINIRMWLYFKELQKSVQKCKYMFG